MKIDDFCLIMVVILIPLVILLSPIFLLFQLMFLIIQLSYYDKKNKKGIRKCYLKKNTKI